MIKIGLYSEDHTLHTLLSSALGKEFEVLLQPDEDGMNVLRAAGDCDVMILDLHSNHDSLQDRIGCTLDCNSGPGCGHGRRRPPLDRL